MKRDLALLFGGIGAGAALVYLLDPDTGRRRRAYLRDQATGAAHSLSDSASKTATDLRNRSRGVVAEAGARFRHEEVSDEVLEARVRSEMGHVISHPGAVRVEARDGHVTLSGPVLAREEGRLLAAVCRVRGVRDVSNQMETHATAGSIPALQGDGKAGGNGQWPPAVRLLAGTAGGVMLFYGGLFGVAKRDRRILPLGAIGLGLMLRSLTNTSLADLAGCCEEALTASLDISASPEEVYRFLTDWNVYARHWDAVREVRREGDRIHWAIDGPGGIPIQWTEAIREMVPNRRIAWESAPGAAIRYEGDLRLEEGPDGGTRLEVEVRCGPVVGAISKAASGLFGVDAKAQVEHDLNHLKSLIESRAAEGETTGRMAA